MITEIDEFHELNLPAGSDDVWSICGKNLKEYYLLNGKRCTLCDLHVINFGDIGANLYFPSLWHCHYTASEYYAKHGEQYPYMKEWGVCSWNAKQAETDVIAATDDTQSQTMEFV